MNDYQAYKDLNLNLFSKDPTPEEILVKKITPPISDDFVVISPCFYKEEPEMVKNSKKLFQKEDIEYVTYGDGEKFTNKVYTNLIRLYSQLTELEDDYTIALIMDAYDTLYLGGGTALMLLSKIRNLNKKRPTVVLASEESCHPNGSDIFYTSGNHTRYLNSGLIIGPLNLIKVMVREMIRKYDLQRFELSNGSLNHSQIYWHRYFNEGSLKENIKIDYENEFFFCMDACNPYHELEMINPMKIRVKKTDTYPKILHFNRCLYEEYKFWFGEFWVESLEELGLR